METAQKSYTEGVLNPSDFLEKRVYRNYCSTVKGLLKSIWYLEEKVSPADTKDEKLILVLGVNNAKTDRMNHFKRPGLFPRTQEYAILGTEHANRF